MKRIIRFILLLPIFTLFACGNEMSRLPFAGKGFGGPQNQNENKIPKRITNDPIVFVHGFLGSTDVWSGARKFFLTNGYNVHELFAIDMGSSYENSARIKKLSEQLKDFIDKVLEYTGRNKVMIVSHSGNGLTVRKYLKTYGIDKVSKCVLIVSPNKGMTFGIFNVIKPNSPLIRELNTPTEEISGLKVLCIRGGKDTYFDRGYQMSPFLKGATNITIHDADHLNIIQNNDTFKAILKFINA